MPDDETAPGTMVAAEWVIALDGAGAGLAGMHAQLDPDPVLLGRLVEAGATPGTVASTDLFYDPPALDRSREAGRSGPLALDLQAAAILGVTDAMAERVRKQDGATLTSIGAIGRAARIKDEDRTDLDADAMVKALRDDNAAVVRDLKALKDSAEEAGDNATSALVDEWQDAAEKRVWFLGQTLR